jgi:DNA (cytosine-5)-methyltransferase 1
LNDLPEIRAGGGQYAPVETKDYTGTYLYDVAVKSYNHEPVTFHTARPHIPQDLKIYKLAVKAWNMDHARISYTDLPPKLQTHHNTTDFLDRFKVVAADLHCSQTVVAHISRDGHYYIHPDIKQNRSLTPREAARLQTIPDNYYFESTKEEPGRTAAFRQIGNAVPVRLAYSVAAALKLSIENDT